MNEEAARVFLFSLFLGSFLLRVVPPTALPFYTTLVVRFSLYFTSNSYPLPPRSCSCVWAVSQPAIFVCRPTEPVSESFSSFLYPTLLPFLHVFFLLLILVLLRLLAWRHEINAHSSSLILGPPPPYPTFLRSPSLLPSLSLFLPRYGGGEAVVAPSSTSE